LYATWSPDGTRIAFSRVGGIYNVNADGTGEAVLLDGGLSPEWSPDNVRIAFVRNGRDPDDSSGDLTVIGLWRYDESPDWQTLPAPSSST
jgi:Tol biopolymer transport system component